MNTMIGGPISHDPVTSPLIDVEADSLSEADRAALWHLFVEIGRCWGNLDDDSASVKSSWLEFIEAKTTTTPSYFGEYRNAVTVMRELVDQYGHVQAYAFLLLRSGIPDGPPTTRLAHLKRYVVDEFIRVQVVAGGFKGFGKPSPVNYNGYVGGSRFNRLQRSTAWVPGTDTEQMGDVS
jgi:hypothetical protein